MASRSMPGILQRGGKKSCLGLRVQSPRLVSSVCTETRPNSLLGGGQKQEAAAVNP